MKHFIVITILTLFLGTTIGCFAQTDNNLINTNKMERADNPKPLNKEKDTQVRSETNLKVLAKGNYSSVEDPFIFIIRNKQNLDSLMEIMDDLKFEEEINFDKNYVVAAFAGMKTTGGHSVEINEKNGNVAVKLNSPPKGSMVTQALTQPYKIVLVAINEEKIFNLDVDNNWKNKAEKYRVKTGTFSYSGGIAGIMKNFNVEGNIDVYTSGKLITLVLDLKSEEKESGRKLNEVISAKLKDNLIIDNDINIGDFIESPHPKTKFKGKISDDKISIQIDSADDEFLVSDGYTGKGNFEALKIN